MLKFEFPKQFDAKQNNKKSSLLIKSYNDLVVKTLVCQVMRSWVQTLMITCINAYCIHVINEHVYHGKWCQFFLTKLKKYIIYDFRI
jgi:hypothetical protein